MGAADTRRAPRRGIDYGSTAGLCRSDALAAEVREWLSRSSRSVCSRLPVGACCCCKFSPLATC
eukprot:995180-Alexandrium_andersonii.AAC.1